MGATIQRTFNMKNKNTQAVIILIFAFLVVAIFQNI